MNSGRYIIRADLNKWIKRSAKKTSGISGWNRDMGPQSSLPYKKAYLSGYEIRIGKNASSNDELLRISHKEDIWLHARGVSGSHVIIVMDKKNRYATQSRLLNRLHRMLPFFFQKVRVPPCILLSLLNANMCGNQRVGHPAQLTLTRSRFVLVAPGDPGVSEE